MVKQVWRKFGLIIVGLIIIIYDVLGLRTRVNKVDWSLDSHEIGHVPVIDDQVMCPSNAK